jgi:crotonobetainyl-CoA:carnitine CoA-transferase CaiB-like acyl-CoA transferase
VSRVLDLTRHAGVYATRLLAEQGYDVVRVESPAGDTVRRQGPFLGSVPDIEDGACHQFFNAGKRSLALDVTTSAGSETFLRLVRTADTIVASAPFPFTEAELRAINPELVLVLLTDDELPELCAYARSGLLSITGHIDRPPALMGGHIIYAATGLWVMIAAAAALLVRKLTGQGQTVTVNIQHCFESFLDHAIENFMARGTRVERAGALGSVTALAGALPSTDGFWMLSLVDSAEQWRTLVDWMDDPVLANDTTLLKYEARKARREEILDRVGAWASGVPKLEIVTEAQRRHIPAAPVSTSLDLANDAQLIDRGFLVETNHPKHGSLLFPRGALATLWDRDITPAPRLGSANPELLRELGYTSDEHVLLFERNIA